MRFSLRHLEVFVATARLESISAAADMLAMSQSAASAALLEFERRYDRPLFDRIGKRLRLNPTGRTLLPLANDLLQRAQDIDALIAGRHGPGTFRLGATQTIGNHIAPHLIETFAQKCNGVRPTLEIGNTAGIAAGIADFRLDVGIVEGELVQPDLHIERWRGDELVLICRKGHPLLEKPTVTMSDLLATGWVVREPGSGMRQALDRAMQPYAAQWQIKMEMPQVQAIIETVAAGELIGCVSSPSLGPSLEQGRVVRLQVPELDLRREFFLVYRRDRFLTAGVEAFLSICRSLPE